MAKRKPGRGRSPSPSARPDSDPRARRKPSALGAGQWLFGTHAVLSALVNPLRECRRLLVSAEVERALARELAAAARARPGLAPEQASRAELDRLFPAAAHQGIALLTSPLAEPTLAELLREGAAADRAVLVVLDQVTDPHNVGAILRSAAAFAALGVVVTERHAPGTSATLAKVASGALETMPFLRVGNLARALEEIKAAGFWCAGLAADAATTIAEAKLDRRVALVLGAEGTGLRRLTRERCDLLVRIPLAAGMESLNVSNAAAIALYELARAREPR